ncbi:MAG: exodeoxyribonuclease VII large subunit [Pseudomonadota bacterium]
MARQVKQSASSSPGEAPSATASNVPEFTVSALAGAIKRTLEDGFGHVRLRGEISGYRGPHASGHCYFGLKDEKAKIDAVVWRGVFSKLKVAPEEGMEVIAKGRVTSYPGASKYQIVVESLEPAGVGALMAVLEARKKQLASEGLFDDQRKQAIPFLPKVVGIVTSPTGAVIRDMLAGFEERYPARVIVWPVRVQGETSGGEVAAAVRGFNALACEDGQSTSQGRSVPRPDLIIVARGGGSLEDLWGFNDEAVVRAVAESDLPVISAVGHETDWTLIDLAADARAPTPTKAAEWAVPKHADLIAQNVDLTARLRTSVVRVIERSQSALKAAARGMPRRDNLLALPRQRFDALEQRLPRALVASTQSHASRVGRAVARLQPGLLRARISDAGDRLRTASSRGREALLRIAGQRRRRLDLLAGRVSVQPLQLRCRSSRERLDATGRRGNLAFQALLDVRRRSLQSAGLLLKSFSYQGVLRRGFALVRDEHGVAVRQASGLSGGSRLNVEFHDGEVGAVVDQIGRTGMGGQAGTGGRDDPSAARSRSSMDKRPVATAPPRPKEPSQISDETSAPAAKRTTTADGEPTRNSRESSSKLKKPEQGTLF